MPTYRIPGLGHVHIRGRKLPDPCAAVVGIGERRHRCADLSAYLCDWPTGSGRTCDAALCEAHAWEISTNRHLCPVHHAEHVDNQAQASLFTGMLESQR